MTTPDAEWLVAVLVVVACAGAAIAAAGTGRSWLSLPSLVPAAAGLFIRATGQHITEASRPWIVTLSIFMVILAVVSGGPLTTWVLGLTDRVSHSNANQPEILRGGATIGYLERIAVVSAVGSGHLSVVAAVIAIKGLGRFTELSTSEARERFIIGTLVSLMWSGLIAGLVWTPG